MATDFIKKEKRQKNLVIVFIIIIAIIFIVLWQGFFKESKPYVPEEFSVAPLLKKDVKIDFKALEKVKNFQSFKFIEPLVGEKGRENPFLPY